MEMEDVLKKIYAVRLLSDSCPDMVVGMSVSELASLCKYIDSLKVAAGLEVNDFLRLDIWDAYYELKKYNDKYHGFAFRFLDAFSINGCVTFADVVLAIKSKRAYGFRKVSKRLFDVSVDFLRDHGVDL